MKKLIFQNSGLSKTVVMLIIISFLSTIVSPVKAQSIEEVQQQQKKREQRIAVGMYGAAAGASLIQRWIIKGRAKKNEKKLKQWQLEGDPRGDCYYINENGHFEESRQDCFYPNGNLYMSNMLCTNCMKLQQQWQMQESDYDNSNFSNETFSSSTNNSEAERLEQERLEAERLEQERLEAERIEAERRAAEEKKQAIEKVVSTVPNDYKFDVVELSDSQKLQLDEVAAVLKKYPDVTVLLTGHTCKIGYKSINMKKGLERANMAKDYLLEKGVREQQIQVESKGELEPITTNSTPEGRAENRRIEISLINN